MNLKPLLLALLLVVSSSCKKKEPQAPPPQPFEVFKVQTKSVPIYQEFVGQIYGEKDIPIRARVVGFLNGIHFQEGETVKKGERVGYTTDYFGNKTAELSAPFKGIVLYIVKTPPANKGEPLFEIGHLKD